MKTKKEINERIKLLQSCIQVKKQLVQEIMFSTHNELTDSEINTKIQHLLSNMRNFRSQIYALRWVLNYEVDKNE